MLLPIAAATLLGGGTGCSNQPLSAAGPLARNLQGMVNRPIDVNNSWAITESTNWRSISDDLGRVFYTDHPSRLTPYPVLDTSGSPR